MIRIGLLALLSFILVGCDSFQNENDVMYKIQKKYPSAVKLDVKNLSYIYLARDSNGTIIQLKENSHGDYVGIIVIQ